MRQTVAVGVIKSVVKIEKATKVTKAVSRNPLNSIERTVLTKFAGSKSFEEVNGVRVQLCELVERYEVGTS